MFSLFRETFDKKPQQTKIYNICNSDFALKAILNLLSTWKSTIWLKLHGDSDVNYGCLLHVAILRNEPPGNTRPDPTTPGQSSAPGNTQNIDLQNVPN